MWKNQENDVIGGNFSHRENRLSIKSHSLFRLSGIPPETTIVIRHDSDDDEDTPKRSRPIALQCMFWFCGILMVLLGAGALVYGIVLLCSKCNSRGKAKSLDIYSVFFFSIDGPDNEKYQPTSNTPSKDPS